MARQGQVQGTRCRWAQPGKWRHGQGTGVMQGIGTSIGQADMGTGRLQT